MDYNTYLQTPHWQSVRQEKLADRSVCQICGADGKLHIHHKFYKDRHGNSILFNEKKSNLVTLCGSCHSLWHRYVKEIRKPNKKFCRIRRLMQVGVKKNKSFWIVGTPGMWESLYGKIMYDLTGKKYKYKADSRGGAEA